MMPQRCLSSVYGAMVWIYWMFVYKTAAKCIGMWLIVTNCLYSRKGVTVINFFDAPETIALRKLIDSKKKYLATIKVEYQYQMLQREILLLEKDILPIVLNNTSVIHSEFVKYMIRCYDSALTNKCNGMLVDIPVK